MSGVIAHGEAQRLRTAIADAIGASTSDEAISESARTALFRVLDVLESSGGAVILPADAFVSTQQAAEILGVSRMTVVRLIDRGELVAEGGSVHRRISAAELEHYRTSMSSRRREAIRELADDISEATPADRVISTR